MRLALSACGATRNLSAVAAAAWGFAKAAVGWGWAAIAWNHEQARVACSVVCIEDFDCFLSKPSTNYYLVFLLHYYTHYYALNSFRSDGSNLSTLKP